MKKRYGNYIGAILHHTTGSENQTLKDMENIAKAKGYGAVSYNYLIKRDTKNNQASIKTGRNIYWVGAHTYIENDSKAKKDPLAKGDNNYYNKNWLGIALIGDYEKNQINSDYLENVIKSIAHIIEVINSKQEQKIKYLRGHREVDNTLCPGKSVYLKMDYIRDKVSKILGYTLLK